MKTAAIRLATLLPVLLLVMILSVLALNTAQAQQNPSGTANPFAEPARPILDAPLPQGGSLPPPGKQDLLENNIDFDNMRVAYVMGDSAVICLYKEREEIRRCYQVQNGKATQINGEKLMVEVVREQVSLYDAEPRRKGRTVMMKWSGSVGLYIARSATPGGQTGNAQAQMFVGSNLPSPSIKAVSASVQYGAPGLTGAGGMPGMAGQQAAAPVQR